MFIVTLPNMCQHLILRPCKAFVELSVLQQCSNHRDMIISCTIFLSILRDGSNTHLHVYFLCTVKLEIKKRHNIKYSTG